MFFFFPPPRFWLEGHTSASHMPNWFPWNSTSEHFPWKPAEKGDRYLLRCSFDQHVVHGNPRVHAARMPHADALTFAEGGFPGRRLARAERGEGFGPLQHRRRLPGDGEGAALSRWVCSRAWGFSTSHPVPKVFLRQESDLGSIGGDGWFGAVLREGSGGFQRVPDQLGLLA